MLKYREKYLNKQSITCDKLHVGGHQCVRHPKVAAFIPPVPICTVAQAG